jgi:hypothetical protein
MVDSAMMACAKPDALFMHRVQARVVALQNR